MGCYHFHLTQLSRGHGQSAIASAAYRSGEKLTAVITEKQMTTQEKVE